MAPKRIHPTQKSKVVSFSMAPDDYDTMTALAKRAKLTRSAWLRSVIAVHEPAVKDVTACDHLPIVRDPKHRAWWTRMGKTNPNRNGGICQGCWPDGPPKRKKEWGRITWTFADGTEVKE